MQSLGACTISTPLFLAAFSTLFICGAISPTLSVAPLHQCSFHISQMMIAVCDASHCRISFTTLIFIRACRNTSLHVKCNFSWLMNARSECKKAKRNEEEFHLLKIRFPSSKCHRKNVLLIGKSVGYRPVVSKAYLPRQCKPQAGSRICRRCCGKAFKQIFGIQRVRWPVFFINEHRWC